MKNAEDNVPYKKRHRKPKIDEVLKQCSGVIKGIHSACNTVADIGPRDFDNLVDSIQSKGLLTPIQVDQNGLLVDGRCRLRACHVLGITLSGEQIVQTSANPKAIAESNIARRHLTRAQKSLLATDGLSEERKHAAERKKAGAVKGRANRKSPLGTETVPSKKTKRRALRAIDAVAKRTGVPRDDLAVAEKLTRKDPKLAEKVFRDEISLVEACKIANVSVAKNAKRKHRKSSNSKQGVEAGSGAKPSKICDDYLTTVTDRVDGVRGIIAKDITIYLDSSNGVQGIVYPGTSKWYYRRTDLPTRRSAATCREAEKALRDWVKGKTDQ